MHASRFLDKAVKLVLGDSALRCTAYSALCPHSGSTRPSSVVPPPARSASEADHGKAGALPRAQHFCDVLFDAKVAADVNGQCDSTLLHLQQAD